MAHLDRLEVEVAEVDEMGGEVSEVASSSAGTSWYSGAPHITATAASSRSIRRNSLTSVPDEPPSLLSKLHLCTFTKISYNVPAVTSKMW